MDTLFWGPGLWIALHSITFNYPIEPTEDEKKQYKTFFNSLKYILPCQTCQQHYTETLEKKFPIEPALINRDRLTRWLVDFHNDVNQRLGKPYVDYNSVKEKYEMMRGKCNLETHKKEPETKKNKQTDCLLFMIILLLVIIISLSIYYFPKLKKQKIRYNMLK